MLRLRSGFTIIELLVVVSIIALLVGILLPAISKARQQALLAVSQANLRQLGAAHARYGADWADRQFTLADDNLASYGSSALAAGEAYLQQNGVYHPPVQLGWAPGGGGHDSGGNRLWGYWTEPPHQSNIHRMVPMNFTGALIGWGSFRTINCKQFSQYVGGRFYDPVFFAPKDTELYEHVQPAFQSPGEYVPSAELAELGQTGWSSYVMSPAAMFGPEVMRGPRPDGTGGWREPFTMPGGLRGPSYAQALYPDLKSLMLEHHWLQQARLPCNPAFGSGGIGDCEPYYFNHGWESVPVTLFYDGHVEGLGVREAEKADARVQAQGGTWLWSRDTSFAEDGYFIGFGYDFAATSFHVLTTDGIRGRDAVGDG